MCRQGRALRAREQNALQDHRTCVRKGDAYDMFAGGERHARAEPQCARTTHKHAACACVQHPENRKRWYSLARSIGRVLLVAGGRALLAKGRRVCSSREIEPRAWRVDKPRLPLDSLSWVNEPRPTLVVEPRLP
eukprot:1791641-Pleurochrysis_carterae.AAC.1